MSLVPRSLGWLRARRSTGRLGDFRLESNSVIRDAFVGFRTMGRLNAARSNAVLVIPWFRGTSRQVSRQIGPGKLVDSSRYFVVIADPLGNGISSSPSNSRQQPGAHFPRFTIGDLVESQHRLLTETLAIDHLRAVVGISMGGMQAFQWLVQHPGYIDTAVSIVGSPQSQPDDRARCGGTIEWLERSAWTRGRHALLQRRPRTALSELRTRADDVIRQAQAMASLDITARFGGSWENAAAVIRAELLVVATWQDAEVNPSPGFRLAKMINADVLELDGRCGHQAPSCERRTLWPAVDRFLSGQRVTTCNRMTA